MIVKNEEKLLAKCLESIVNHVDEIIVVDTGSSDKTKEIALSFGAKVHDFKWANDFSAARNFAKKQASKKWILQMDADEYFETKEALKIKTLVNEINNQAVVFHIVNFKKLNVLGTIHTNIRLFQNIEDVSYVYKLHEQPYYNGKIINDIHHADISIMHLGYLQEIINDKNKMQRNLEILQNELKHNPNDRFTIFNIASEYLASKNFEKAMYYYQKATKNEKDISMLQKGILKMVVCYELSGRDDQALALLEKGKKLFPDYTDLFFLEGEILQKNGREKDAYSAFTMCLTLGEAKNRYVSNSGIGTTMPLIRLAKLACINRDFQKAIDYYSQVIHLDRYNEEAATTLFCLLKNLGEIEETISLIHALYTNTVPKDVVFKYRLFSELMIKEEFLSISEILKAELHGAQDDSTITSSFYYYLLKGELRRAGDMLEENKPIMLPLYYHFHPDYNLTDIVDFTLSGLPLSTSTYLSFLNELMRLGEYKMFEEILEFHSHFSDDVLKGIANIFYTSQKDDLAFDFFLKYTELGYEEAGVYLKLAELLFNTEYIIDAISFAEKAFNLNTSCFKPIELIIESYLKLGEINLAKDFALDMLNNYPKSKYLSTFK